jgi:hypothetical protein
MSSKKIQFVSIIGRLEKIRDNRSHERKIDQKGYKRRQ